MPAVNVTVTDPSSGLSSTATATITITGTTNIQVGQTTIGTINDTGNGNVIIAQPITLTQQGTLVSLSLYVKTVSGQVRLGIYSGTTPTTLVTQTQAFTPTAGWNTSVAMASPTLVPGAYWLTFICQNNAMVVEKVNASSAARWKSLTFGAMPTQFPASPNSENSLWSLYGTFSVGPPPPLDTIPPSIPTNLRASLP